MVGGDLEARLFRQTGVVLAWWQRLQIIRAAARALLFLHTPGPGKGVVLHRDIKPGAPAATRTNASTAPDRTAGPTRDRQPRPSHATLLHPPPHPPHHPPPIPRRAGNILLDERLNAKLSDVGLGRNQADGRTHNSTGKVLGTPGYIDPAFVETLQYAQRTDAYALGVTLLVTFTGRQPVHAKEAGLLMFVRPSVAPKYGCPAAGWPAAVARTVATIVRGLTWNRIAPHKRISLPQALHALEKLCASEPRVPDGVVLEVADAAGAEPAARCVLCMVDTCSVHFGCGHACCCLSCAQLLAGRAGACPACRSTVVAGAWRVTADSGRASGVLADGAQAPVCASSDSLLAAAETPGFGE
jgi:serine/threonine protein kinase